ncbi:MAG TPA: NMD3-related protein [Candidatus Bilamarchaeum sp.]|nr:NMD3-related protein [Candidatus Bilamarchaeum sp.]
MSDLICPRCGRSSREVKFIEAFCADCAPVRLECPAKVELEQCGRCLRGKIRGEWTPVDAKKIDNLVIARCRGEYVGFAYDQATGKAVFELENGASVEREILFEIKKTICQQCSRISGGYYEGIIQLRGNREKAAKYAEKLALKLSKSTFIAKVDEKDEGIDIFVGSSKSIVAIMSDEGVRALITKKLIGRDQGKRLYRTTFLIRL